jgi:hypothetical protein
MSPVSRIIAFQRARIIKCWLERLQAAPVTGDISREDAVIIDKLRDVITAASLQLPPTLFTPILPVAGDLKELSVRVVELWSLLLGDIQWAVTESP